MAGPRELPGSQPMFTGSNISILSARSCSESPRCHQEGSRPLSLRSCRQLPGPGTLNVTGPRSPLWPPRIPPWQEGFAQTSSPSAALGCHSCAGTMRWERRLTAPRMDSRGFGGVLSSALRAELRTAPKPAPRAEPVSFTGSVSRFLEKGALIAASQPSTLKPAQRSGTHSKRGDIPHPAQDTSDWAEDAPA